MIVYNVGIRGGLKKIRKADFNEDEVYLIDDTKSLYIWLGSSISKKRKELSVNKANLLNNKKEIPVSIQIVNQNKEFGSFLDIKDLLQKGINPKQDLDRRPELEIQYEETVELIDAGINPDLEAEITIAAHKLSQENKSYKELCSILAQLQLNLLKDSKSMLKKDIEKKTLEIFKSSSTYEELCWLIAELKAIKNKHSFTS
ncbi:MAG TPA: hypothetical protein VMV43_04880 [Candidatus Nanopelagicaceae bacterium]|nr:hypothetical protein [Candidatus Nanopelagicaceae bacterium]